MAATRAARNASTSTSRSPTPRLSGYAALGQRISADADERSEKLLNLHRTLFYATIGVILLVALFIFRPMSECDPAQDA